MAPGSDGIFVAAPAWHRFMQGALDRLDKGERDDVRSEKLAALRRLMEGEPV